MLPNLGSFSHLKSLHSRCCRHKPTRTDNTELFSHSSGRKLPSLPGGRNGSNRWVLKISEKKKKFSCESHSSQARFPLKYLFPKYYGRLLTTVHLITSILTVDHLVTAAVVGDTAAIFTLELSWFAQGHCRTHMRFHKS